LIQNYVQYKDSNINNMNTKFVFLVNKVRNFAKEIIKSKNAQLLQSQKSNSQIHAHTLHKLKLLISKQDEFLQKY